MSVRARSNAAAFLVATIAVGCAGRGETGFSLADARQLAGLRPVAPGWTWPSESEKRADSGAPASDPLLAEFRRETKGLVDLGEAGNEWQDADKLAHVDVAVFETTADAHEAFDPFNTLSLGWASQSGKVVS